MFNFQVTCASFYFFLTEKIVSELEYHMCHIEYVGQAPNDKNTACPE